EILGEESLEIYLTDGTLGNGDEEILDEFDKSVSFVDGRYRVSLPWKPRMREALQNNKTVARKRFEGLVHRFKCDHELFCEYKNMVDDYVREAFTADVKSAFLQIELDLRDRDFTRFFWTDNLNNEPYVLNFTRVLFGLRPSQYLLAATLRHHFKKYKEQYLHTFALVNSSIYVDDLIYGQNNVPVSLRTTLECFKYSVTQACYCSNDEVIRNNLICYGSKKMSKRNSLKLVLLILDHQLRIFGLWDWDSELPSNLRHKWQQWSSEAEGLTEIKIPRFYLGDINKEISKFEIHCFSDASKSAYGKILYLRFVTCNNEIKTSFIRTKSRVAHLKSWTLPRLELTAALLSSRLAKQRSNLRSKSVSRGTINSLIQSKLGTLSGKDNLAELLSYDTSAVKLAQNELW
ncbi:uncharacterized protein TNIN_96561, partial [Trichonephila inaurata madagascariensis]